MHVDVTIAAVKERKTGVALLSVGSNTILVAGKLVVGILIGSVSVISEAIHSGIDLIAAGIALFAVRRSAKPADEEHQFGHGKVENLSGAIEAILILVAAVWIVREAANKLLAMKPIETPGWGVGVMLVSAAMNIFVSRRLFKVARETRSIALEADAWHLMTDVYTSAGVMGGLIIIWLGHQFMPAANLDLIDPLAALVVAALIGKAAMKLTIQAGHDLLDGSLPAEEEEWIRGFLEGRKPTIRHFHKLRTRRAGSSRIVDFHILVDPKLSVEASHRITEDIKRDFIAKFPGSFVTIHVEPDNAKERSDS